MAYVRGEIRRRWEPGALTWAIPMCAVAAGYALHLFGLYAAWPDKWFYALAAAIAIFSAVSYFHPSAIYSGAAVFASGLAIASSAHLYDAAWARVLYVPAAALAARLAGWPGALVAVLMVPVIEARWMLLGEDQRLFWAIIGASLAVGLLGAMGQRRRASEQARHGLPIFGSSASPRARRDDSPDEHFGFMDMGGLERMDDEDLRELLRATLFAMRAQSVSLFTLDGESPALRYTSASSSSMDETLISPVPRWFIGDVARLRHTIVTGNLGAEGSPASIHHDAAPDMDGAGAVSIAAAPVMEGSVMLGVLAVNSPMREAFAGSAPTVLEIFSAMVARLMARKRILAEGDHDIRRMELMNREGLKLVASLDMAEIGSVAAEAVRGISQHVDAYIMLRAQGGAYRMLHEAGHAAAASAPFTLDGTLAEMAVSEMEGRYFSNLRGYSRQLLPVDMPAQPASALLLPLVYGGEALGLMALVSTRVDALRPRQVELLKAFAGQVTMAMKNSMLHSMVTRRAITDGLTGLFNRTHLMDLLTHEHARYGRTGAPFCLLLLDVDHFKSVNDSFGHQAGDAVLRGVAATIKAALRETDFIGRYGGEEFAAVLVDTLPEGAEALAERIREAVEDRSFEHASDSIRVTISIGLAESLPDLTLNEIVRRADAALYEAKDAGRNRVIRWYEIERF